MAVSKRARFEILRRDNHTCQYCGGKAPDVTLHVDHIIPVTLGGTDQPGNLVAACKDCNLGKSSVPADAPLVDEINSRAGMYALDMRDRATRIRAVLEAESEYLSEFEDTWNGWTAGGEKIPLPHDYKTSIYRFCRLGVPQELVERAIEIAMKKTGLKSRHGEFQYMAGVVWRTLDESEVTENLTTQTVAVFTENELEERLVDERIDAYTAGYAKAQRDMEGTDAA